MPLFLNYLAQYKKTTAQKLLIGTNNLPYNTKRNEHAFYFAYLLVLDILI